MVANLLKPVWRWGWTKVRRARIAKQIYHRMSQRFERGHETYGDNFHGEPFDHLEEEAHDLLWYMMIAQERYEELLHHHLTAHPRCPFYNPEDKHPYFKDEGQGTEDGN